MKLLQQNEALVNLVQIADNVTDADLHLGGKNTAAINVQIAVNQTEAAAIAAATDINAIKLINKHELIQ